MPSLLTVVTGDPVAAIRAAVNDHAAQLANAILEGDPRLTDTRVPTDSTVTAAKVAAALKPSGTAAAGTEALRALGTTPGTALAGDSITAFTATLLDDPDAATARATLGVGPDVSAVPQVLRHVAGLIAGGTSADWLLLVYGDSLNAIALTSTVGYKAVFRLHAPATVAGKTAKIRLLTLIAASSAAPLTSNTTVTARLHAVASRSGGVLTLGTQIISETVINNTTLAADANATLDGAWFDHPGAGLYAISLHASRVWDGSNALASTALEQNYQ